MKKIMSIIICLCLVFSVSACTPMNANTTTGTSAPSEETSAATTGADYTDPSVTYQAPMAAVAVPVTTQTTYAEDKTAIFSFTYQDISLTLEDADVADEIIVDFLNRNDFNNSSAQSILDAAKTAYTGQTDWEPYFCSITYNPMRLDQSILSFYGAEVVYNGTPRSVSANISVSYDLLTGKALALKDVLNADYSAEDLVQLILNALSSYRQEGILFTDHEYIISDLFSTNTPVDSWYLSQAGLCFYFTPYEIAPYNAGTIVAEIPYEKLGGILKDDYFPAEEANFSGEPVCKKLSEVDIASFRQFTEVILDAQGEEIVLHTDGTLMDVRLETGSWSSDGSEFIPTATVFAACALTTGDALIIQAALDSIDDLRLSYTSNGAPVSIPLEIQAP